MDEKLQEYADKFKDNFPILMVRNLDEDEIIKLIDKAIKDNKPYTAQDKSGGVY